MVSAVKVSVFVAGAASALMHQRTVNNVLKNLVQLDHVTRQFITDCKTYNGNSSETLLLQEDINAIENAINNTRHEYSTEHVLSSKDSVSILSYVNNVLLPDAKTAVATAHSKKSEFTHAGLSSLVDDNSKNVKNYGDSLGAVAKTKASSDQVSNFQRAINTFNSIMTA